MSLYQMLDVRTSGNCVCVTDCAACPVSGAINTLSPRSDVHHDDMSRPEKECPELPDPDSGQVHLTGRNFQVSDILTFLMMIILTLCRIAPCTPVTGATAWSGWRR